MTEPLNVASCGECFETFVEPGSYGSGVVDEVMSHIETQEHRNDVTFGTIE